jgi:carbamoyl-phosphate synthase large subunit
MDKKAIMIFGVGELQESIIKRAKAKGLFVVGIDPCADAVCRNEVDAFEVVGGQDYEGTLAVARKYNISAVVTAATDKPLVMMARVAKELGLPFYSEETAQISTDKFRMKESFRKGGIPCANGGLIKSIDEAEGLVYPVILKPRDNSGSRGVIFCNNKSEFEAAFNEAMQYTKLDSVLVEEFIEGQEYSIEGLHYDGKSEVIQFTEKKTTPFPYNVELRHTQPANLSEEHKKLIRKIVADIAIVLGFENCPSHTELKINKRGIFVIETSPRLGGGYITSTLTPLSTGINMEDQLLNIAIGTPVDTRTGRVEKASSVHFFSLPEGVVISIDKELEKVREWSNIESFDLKLRPGSIVTKFKSGLDRYGQFIINANNREEVDYLIEEYSKKINDYIKIE